MKSRLLVAALGVPLLLYVILWAPPLVLMAGVLLLAGIAALELMRCIGAGKSYLCTLAVIGACFTVDWYYERPAYIAIWWVICVLGIFLYAVVRGGEVPFLHVLAGIFAVVMIPYSFSAFLRLDAAGYHRGFLLLPLIFSFMSDTGGYFAGRAFGKHKLAPRVSPKKTIEGSIGGLLGNVAGGLVFAFVMNTWFGHAIGYFGIAMLGLLCSVVAQLGDLSFSLIKREFGIKDYGRIFLEHGGVLDRFDSVLFVAPLLEILLPLVHMG